VRNLERQSSATIGMEELNGLCRDFWDEEVKPLVDQLENWGINRVLTLLEGMIGQEADQSLKRPLGLVLKTEETEIGLLIGLSDEDQRRRVLPRLVGEGKIDLDKVEECFLAEAIFYSGGEEEESFLIMKFSKEGLRFEVNGRKENDGLVYSREDLVGLGFRGIQEKILAEVYQLVK